MSNSSVKSFVDRFHQFHPEAREVSREAALRVFRDVMAQYEALSEMPVSELARNDQKYQDFIFDVERLAHQVLTRDEWKQFLQGSRSEAVKVQLGRSMLKNQLWPVEGYF